MRQLLFVAVVCGALAMAAFGVQRQNQPAQPNAQNPQNPQGQRGANADPYANNAAPGTTSFPLAAPAGKDSNARTVPPAGSVNQGPFDPGTWKYGPAFDAPAGSKVWNPVRLKMQQGGKVTGGTLFSSTDPATYC